MNVVHRSPVKGGRRRRMRSSSASTHSDVQSSIGAYSGLQGGRLGKDFSLIKMGTQPQSVFGEGSSRKIDLGIGAHPNDVSKVSNQQQASPILKVIPQSTNKPLPPWLCNTFSNLVAKHPLRLLLPKPPRNPDNEQLTTSRFADAMDRPATPENDPVFAFSPLDQLQTINTHTSRMLVPEPPRSQSAFSSLDRSHIEDPLLIFLPSQDNNASAYSVLPFSTPGPGSHISKTSSTLSTDQLKDIHIKPPSQYDDNAQAPNFIPFSTPGPGSMVSATTVSPVNCARAPSTSEIQPTNPPERPLNSNEDHKSSSTSHALVPTIPSNRPLDIAGIEPTLPLQTSHYDTAPGYSSDDVSDYVSTPNDDIYTDESTSDPPLCCDAYILPNLFATPGPGHRPPRPIYFDSPAEDPLDSDPLQPGYEIDYDTLDFHWTPFNRKSTNEPEKKSITVQPLLEEYVRGTDDENENITAFATLSKIESQEGMKSPGPFRFYVADETFDDSHQLEQPTTPEPEKRRAPVFAPAPGIFISPLRDPFISKSQHEEACSPNSQTALVRIMILCMFWHHLIYGPRSHCHQHSISDSHRILRSRMTV